MGKLLFIVSRLEPERYDDLARAFAGEETVEVILDRRRGERRLQRGDIMDDRRRRDRRVRDVGGELSRLGWAIVRR